MERLPIRPVTVMLFLAVLLLGELPAPGLQKDDPPDDLGKKVVDAARAKLDMKVGDGTCYALVMHALMSAGAKTTRDYGVDGPDKDYIWGKLVDNLKDAQPGDLVQYRDVKIQLKNGGMELFRHHSAIVAVNQGKGDFKLLEQNINNKDVVQETSRYLGGVKEGKLWIYRPEKK